MNAFSGKLLAWFRAGKRDLPWRRTRDIYRIWVSEVMLQQTQVATVIPYYERFLRCFPTVRQLADAPEDAVLKAWEGLGYYARARNLHRAAKQVVADLGGRVPDTPEAFRALPGVGDYIVAAVLSIARGQALPVVDGNVLRVVARHEGLADDIARPATRDAFRRLLEARIPEDEPGAFNEALMELGATVCTPRRPRCPDCPIRAACRARIEARTGELPVKGRARPVPVHRASVAVLVRSGRLLIQKRPAEGLLGGLWEFPGGKAKPGETPLQTLRRECREETGVEPPEARRIAVVRHRYSHFEVVLSVYLCPIGPGRVRCALPSRWIRPCELERFAFPAANRRFFPELLAALEQVRRRTRTA